MEKGGAEAEGGFFLLKIGGLWLRVGLLATYEKIRAVGGEGSLEAISSANVEQSWILILPRAKIVLIPTTQLCRTIPARVLIFVKLPTVHIFATDSTY